MLVKKKKNCQKKTIEIYNYLWVGDKKYNAKEFYYEVAKY